MDRKVNSSVKKLKNFLQKYPEEKPLFYKLREKWVRYHLKEYHAEDDYFFTDVFATLHASFLPPEGTKN